MILNKKVTHILAVAVICLFSCDSVTEAQSSYHPKITVKAENGSVRFNYGNGVFTCSKFLIQTKLQGNNHLLTVDVDCEDKARQRILRINNIKNSSLYNIGSSAWPKDNPNLPAVLICEGGCNPEFTVLRVGNLDGWAKNKTQTSIFGCYADNAKSCTKMPLEVKILRKSGVSSIYVRIGSWKKFEQSKGMFDDSEDPNGPRTSKNVGGTADKSKDVAVEATSK